MATTSVDISIDADGNSLAVLSDLIAKRAEFLRDETTENAVKATAINVISSIRARTKVANPDKASEFGIGVFPAPGVVAGYKGHPARLVVREIGGHEMKGSKIVNLIGNYQRGVQMLCFTVIFKSPKVAERFSGGHERVYVVARSAADVRAWAKKRLGNYVRRYSGMAKWALGQAQRQIHNTRVEDVDGAAKSVALKNLIVFATGDGYGSGNFSITLEDRLDYATLALEGGAADVDLSMKKAANRTAAIINKLGTYRLDEPIPTPFPEVVEKKK